MATESGCDNHAPFSVVNAAGRCKVTVVETDKGRRSQFICGGGVGVKIYVGGSSKDQERVKVVQDALRAQGHVITHDWTAEQYDPNWASHPQDWTEKHLEQTARDDMIAIANADVTVFVLERSDVIYRGAWSELGIALVHGKPVYILGGEGNRNNFAYMPNVYRNYTLDRLLEVFNPVPG